MADGSRPRRLEKPSPGGPVRYVSHTVENERNAQEEFFDTIDRLIDLAVAGDQRARWWMWVLRMRMES